MTNYNERIRRIEKMWEEKQKKLLDELAEKIYAKIESSIENWDGTVAAPFGLIIPFTRDDFGPLADWFHSPRSYTEEEQELYYESLRLFLDKVCGYSHIGHIDELMVKDNVDGGFNLRLNLSFLWEQ